MSEVSEMGQIVTAVYESGLLRPLHRLNLREREVVRLQILPAEASVVQSKVDAFLSLRGALADDEDFDRAVTMMEKAWQTWTAPVFA